MSIIEIREDEFEKEVLKSEKIVLVDFYANWCGPCKMLRPVLDSVAGSHTDIKVVSINVDEAENLAMSYGISSIPCVIKFKDGNELERSIGFKSKEEIEKLIEG